MGINKVVVGSGHGGVPKYAGQGVALRGTPRAPGVPWPQFSCSTAVFRQFSVCAPRMHCVRSTSSYFWMLHR